jgi:hypothetical protein
MKFLFWKLFLSISLIIASSTVHAYDVFAYTALKLPFSLHSENSWYKIINSQEEWETFYNQLITQNMPSTTEPAPQIDFEHYQMVTGGIGIRGSGGYSVFITNVYEFDTEVDLEVLEISPGPGCIVTAAIDYPSATILIKRTSKSIKFIPFQQLVHQCP